MSLYPPLDLVLRLPGVELRLLADPELESLVTRAAGRVLPAEHAGFMGSWTQLPSPLFERQALAYHWRRRAEISPAGWELNFGVFPDQAAGEAVGVQSLSASAFTEHRVVSTGSWLIAEHQGRGLGTTMRTMVLELAFTGLRAREATSSAHLDNLASQAISRRLGYHDLGRDLETVDGHGREAVRFRLPVEDWARRPAVALSGLAPCLEMLGAA